MTEELEKSKIANELSFESQKRPQFGNRHLVDASKVFEHNAWDNVEWDEELAEDAKKKIELNAASFLSADDKEKYESNADEYWNKFYGKHENKFFKDRHWLFTEFPDLSFEQMSLKSSTEKTNVFEVGCGVGNTVFPLLQSNNHPNLFVYCCDISSSAIDILKEHTLYNTDRCNAFVCNISDDEEPLFPFPSNSVDIITLIFVLSAIHPDKMNLVLKRLAKVLKPGGILLFRDYGQYDMVQLRFKPGHCLSENFYVRGDGTRVYFFTQEELDQMLNDVGLVKIQNTIDRRLQINRGRKLKMYRIWIQCKYMKPIE